MAPFRVLEEEMLIRSRGNEPIVDASAFVAPTAALVGRITVGPGSFSLTTANFLEDSSVFTRRPGFLPLFARSHPVPRSWRG
jgi:hypothetical protein